MQLKSDGKSEDGFTKHRGESKVAKLARGTVEITLLRKPSQVRGEECCTGIEEGLVCEKVFWRKLNWFVPNAGLLQDLPVLLDVGLIRDTFQSLPELSKRRLQLHELRFKVGLLETPVFAAHVSLSRIIKVYILPGDTVLVEVDPAHSLMNKKSTRRSSPSLPTSGLQSAPIPRSTSLLLGHLR